MASVAQDNSENDSLKLKNSISVGLMHGGGSLLGADYERLIFRNFGGQFGFGLLAAGAGVNWHLKPEINCSFVSVQYWYQGWDGKFLQSVGSANFVYRSKKKWLTFQLGLGYRFRKGDHHIFKETKTSFLITYAVGGAFYR